MRSPFNVGMHSGEPTNRLFYAIQAAQSIATPSYATTLLVRAAPRRTPNQDSAQSCCIPAFADRQQGIQP